MSEAVKVLFVDDQQSNLTVYEASFEGLGCELVFARSGHEALELAREQDFAVILLDVQMPGMDGYEAARRLHQIPRARVTPIIFVTASYPDEAHVQRGYQSGAVDFLFKPFNLEHLRAKVGIFVELRRARVDIERLRETEAALREAVAVRDDFLSIASHELKTPLTPLQLQLQSFLRMLDQGKLDHVPVDRLRRMLEISDGQVTRLSTLVEQLLDLSRINEGRLRLDPERVDLGALTGDVLLQFQHVFDTAGCPVSFEREVGLTGIWDKFRLEQVIVNLLTNAMKYGRGKPIRVTVFREGEHAVLRVRDEGIGIAKEDQRRIFGRFERAVCSRNFGGLGLGLYIANQIVKLHHGTIRVESEKGQGALFEVALPLTPVTG